MKCKKYATIVFTIIFLILVGCSNADKVSSKGKATVFKSPTCGCCVGYSSYLKGEGFDVEIVEMEDLTPIKQRYNIPRSMESCHTTIIGDYFVEGHVPIEAVEKMLREKPDISGIALPNMPSGTPGMPGPKRGMWTIYGLSKGSVSEFTKI